MNVRVSFWPVRCLRPDGNPADLGCELREEYYIDGAAVLRVALKVPVVCSSCSPYSKPAGTLGVRWIKISKKPQHFTSPLAASFQSGVQRRFNGMLLSGVRKCQRSPAEFHRELVSPICKPALAGKD